MGYGFNSDENKGMPGIFINYGISDVYAEGPGSEIYVAFGICASEKFKTLAKLYDQVRLKGMSVKISYMAGNGLSAENLEMVAMVDRCATPIEMFNNYSLMTGTAQDRDAYMQKVKSASSMRRISLTGGKSIYFYLKPSTLQEKQFVNIKNGKDTVTEPDLRRIAGMDTQVFNGFNPCIYSYVENGLTSSTVNKNISFSVEIKYYVEFRNSC